MKIDCGLKGSEWYCETHRGICCACCPEVRCCIRRCLNAPERCGYAGGMQAPAARKEVPHGGSETAD